MHSQATLQCTPRAPVCINTCKVQLTRLAPACTGICNLQCTWGRGGKCFSPQGPETLAARDALRLGYRWRGVADRLSLRSRRPRAGRGLTRGFSRAGAWGPGRGGGGCAWLGWSCSPFNRRRRASPPPPPPRPFSGGSSRPARRAPPPGPGRRRRRVPSRPSLGPARAAGTGRSGRRKPVRRRQRQRQRRSETEEDAAPVCRARGCGRRPRIGGGAQRGRCSGRGSGERGGGGRRGEEAAAGALARPGARPPRAAPRRLFCTRRSAEREPRPSARLQRAAPRPAKPPP